MIGIKTLENEYEQIPCLLIGNGPSLSKWYARLYDWHSKYLTIGMNLSWKPPIETPQFEEFHSHYHCIINASQLRHTINYDGAKWTRAVVTGMSNKRHLKDRQDGLLLPQVGHEDIWRFDLHRGTDARFTGMMALQLAVYLGCNPIYMLGYDAHPTDAHHWGGPPPRRRSVGQRAREFHVQDMERAARRIAGLDVQVLNANAESAITAFPFGEPE